MKSVINTFVFGSLIIYLSCNSVNSNENSETLSETKQEEKSKLVIANTISEIKCPINFSRIETDSYGKWMRNLKLNEDNTVYYYNGDKKPDQSIHVSVLNFDIGTRDLQQCADACMRIRAEYLFEQKKYDQIKFLLANGKRKSFKEYTTKRDYKSFRKYMTYIFSYANTASLKKQMKQVGSFKNIQIGDVLVQSGNPYGHAVTVMDVCENEKGERMFMLSQSYMPAQNIEILINPKSLTKSPWYPVDFEDDLVTPEWVFSKLDLKRF
ncbi:MAG: DUF4846 domain-containing protein [Flavobacteriales bacterium]